MAFIPDLIQPLPLQSKRPFLERFIENLKRAPRQLFLEQPTAIAKPGIKAISKFIQPAIRPIAQIGVAAGRALHGEIPQQPAFLPGPIGKFLGDVGIGTPLQETGRLLETGLTIAPGTVLKPLAPLGRPIAKVLTKGGTKIMEKLLRIPKRTVEAGKSPAEFFVKEAPITTEEGLKKWLQDNANILKQSIERKLAGRTGQIGILKNEILADTETVLRTRLKGASDEIIEKMLNRIQKETILGKKAALTLEELNTVRSYIDNNLLSEREFLNQFGKLTGKGKALKAGADAMRIKVQTLAPETANEFAKLSKFITAIKSLKKEPADRIIKEILLTLGPAAVTGERALEAALASFIGRGIARTVPVQISLAKILAGAAKKGPQAITQTARFLPFLKNQINQSQTTNISQPTSSFIPD